MKTIQKLAIATGGLVLAACATTGETQTAQSSFTNGVNAKGEQTICRDMTETGSRFKKKECKTAQEWNDWYRVNRDMTRDMVRTSIKKRKGG